MANYEIDPEILAPFVPHGVTLDAHRGRYFMSLVAFLFEDTKVAGWSVPLHENFEELNLRFYVRREVDGERRRGVVFIKEVVPRYWVAAIARRLYNENYIALPMRNVIDPPSRVRYEWKFRGKWNHVALTTEREGVLPETGSDQEFITEHYWGYVKQRDGSSREYRVEHPRWRVWNARAVEVNCDVAELYGEHFAPAFANPPASAFLAEGSAVTVFHPAII
jgi:uncharacterized protein